MSTVITFSRFFPADHPRKGQPTIFVEKIWKSFSIKTLNQIFYEPKIEYVGDLNAHLSYLVVSDFRKSLVNYYLNADINPKKHTIRKGKRWKAGDKFSPRVWSGKPYASKQIIIAQDMVISRVADIEIDKLGFVYINGEYYNHIMQCDHLALNDGLDKEDFANWLNKLPFSGQILIWNDEDLPY
jgi:hypothetical protein